MLMLFEGPFGLAAGLKVVGMLRVAASGAEPDLIDGSALCLFGVFGGRRGGVNDVRARGYQSM
jgi:hypothetical protein